MADAFPHLTDLILDTMALRPSAPMTEPLLYDALDGQPTLRGLTLAHVEAAAQRLVNLDLLVRATNPLNGVAALKLTTSGKLNRGVA